jgi:23S rRNA (adenine2503-C2)-methyltransferase
METKTQSTEDKRSLMGLPRDQLSEALNILDIPEKQKNMRLNQVWGWLYNKGSESIDEMTTLSLDLRKELENHFDLSRPLISEDQISEDGTRKWLLKFKDGSEVETVFIPDNDRGTLCVSSQVGCTLNCTFCHTGTQKLVRNLTAQEIIAQVVVAKDCLNEWNPEPRQITNIVMMGMGEPLYNFENVRDGIITMADDAGLSISKRRITLSTSGIVPMIKSAGEEIASIEPISSPADFIIGTIPEVESVILLFDIERPASSAIVIIPSRTFSKLYKGSPMPIITILVICLGSGFHSFKQSFATTT